LNIILEKVLISQILGRGLPPKIDFGEPEQTSSSQSQAEYTQYSKIHQEIEWS